jgi:hypothetical protein
VESKDRFMAAYRAGRAAYQDHSMNDMERWEVWVGIGLASVVGASYKIFLERYVNLPWIERFGIPAVAVALVWAGFFAIRKRWTARND